MGSFIQQIFLERQLKKNKEGARNPDRMANPEAVCSSHGGELANRAPGQAVSTSSSGWHGMPREDKPARKSQSAHGRRHKHGEGRSHEAGSPCTAPGRAAKADQAVCFQLAELLTTEHPRTQPSLQLLPASEWSSAHAQWRRRASRRCQVLALPCNVWVTWDKFFPMARIPHLANRDNSTNQSVLLWWVSPVKPLWTLAVLFPPLVTVFCTQHVQGRTEQGLWGQGHRKMGIKHNFSTSRKNWQTLRIL